MRDVVTCIFTHPSHFCQSVELDAVFLADFIVMTRDITLYPTPHITPL